MVQNEARRKGPTSHLHSPSVCHGWPKITPLQHTCQRLWWHGDQTSSEKPSSLTRDHRLLRQMSAPTICGQMRRKNITDWCFHHPSDAYGIPPCSKFMPGIGIYLPMDIHHMVKLVNWTNQSELESTNHQPGCGSFLDQARPSWSHLALLQKGFKPRCGCGWDLTCERPKVCFQQKPVESSVIIMFLLTAPLRNAQDLSVYW